MCVPACTQGRVYVRRKRVAEPKLSTRTWWLGDGTDGTSEDGWDGWMAGMPSWGRGKPQTTSQSGRRFCPDPPDGVEMDDGGLLRGNVGAGSKSGRGGARERRIERSMAPAGATFGWTLRLHGIGLVGMRLCYCASRLSVTLASFGGCGRSLVCGDELALPTSWPNGSSQARGGPGLGRRVSRVS